MPRLHFSVDLKDCEHCILCSNLRHKKFHILNEAFSEEEYFKKLKEYGFDDPAKFAEAEKFFAGEFVLKFPHRSVHQTKLRQIALEIT